MNQAASDAKCSFDIITIVRNDLRHDNRVKKIAMSLVESGRTVLVVARAPQDSHMNVQGVTCDVAFLPGWRDGKRYLRRWQRLLVLSLATVPIVLGGRSKFIVNWLPRVVGASSFRQRIGCPNDDEEETRGQQPPNYEGVSDGSRKALLQSEAQAGSLRIGFFSKVVGIVRMLLRLPLRTLRGTLVRSNFVLAINFYAEVLAFNLFVFELLRCCTSPVVVHNDWETGLSPMWLRRNLELSVIYDSHELWLDRNSHLLRSRWGHQMGEFERAFETNMVEGAKLVITVCSGIADVLCGRYDLPREKVVVIRNLPRLEASSREQVPAEGSKVLPVSATSAYSIAYSGRITTGRNLERLIRAVAGLSEIHDIKVRLIGYGSGAYVEEIKRLACEMGVWLQVEDPVPMADVPTALALSDIVFVGVDRVSKSYELSLPNKFFEALMSGRAILIPGLQEMLRESETLSGVEVYEPSSVESIQEAIRNGLATKLDLLRVKAERQRFGQWDSEATVLTSFVCDEVNRSMVRELGGAEWNA